MTFNAIIKKRGKLLGTLAAILTIFDIVLKFLGIIPAITAVIILLLAAILLLPFLVNLKLNPKFKKLIVSTIVITFFIGLGYYFISAKPEEKTLLLTNIEQNQYTDNSNTNSVTNTSIEKQTRQTINADNSHLVIGNNNHVNVNGDVNNYNTLPQRKLNKTDLKKLKSIPFTDKKIQILYPPNSNEALNYGNEVFNKLFALGHCNISKGIITNPIKRYSSNRLNLVEEKDSDLLISIIINPQQ